MALQVASLFGVLSLDDKMSGQLDSAEQKARGFGSRLAQLGQNVTGFAANITTLFAAVGIALGIAVTSAVAFNESMTNTGAVLGKTQAEMAALSQEILDIGAESRAGPQAVAAAYYDIAGGIQNASTHMDVLRAAIALAEAGNTDLASSAKGLISVMNAYDLSAADAARVSDIFTRAVGMGVGTMSDFTNALGPASGLAFDLGISFEELAASTAFLTSTGSTASESVTQLTGIMSAFLKPNSNMTAALAAMGYESGTAAIEALGLQGAVNALSTAVGGSTDELAKALGTQEALGGAIGLLNDRATDFTASFTAGLNGATEAARNIQNASPAAQFDFLRSTVQALGIEVGTTLLPALIDLVDIIRPVINSVIGWVRQNPRLTATIGAVGAGLAVLGPILLAVGAAMTGIGAIVAVIGSPIGLLVGLVAGLALAFESNFLGIRTVVQPVLDTISNGFNFLREALGWFVEDIRQYGLLEAIKQAFGLGGSYGESWLEGVLVSFGMARETAVSVLDSITSALGNVSAFIQNTVIPGVQAFFQFLADAWSFVSPHLANLYNWFISDALPAIVGFVQNTVLPGVRSFFQFLADAWLFISPALSSIYNWFVIEAMPAITNFISNTALPAVRSIFDFIRGAWDLISPHLVQSTIGLW